MAEKRLNFTKAAIDALPSAPRGKRAYYYDTKAKALVIGVTDKGTKSFLVYRRVNGPPERITLGRYATGLKGGLTIEQARKAAADVNLAIAKGENPAERKRLARGELTLGMLFSEYMSRHAEVHNRRPDKAKSNYRLCISRLGPAESSLTSRKPTFMPCTRSSAARKARSPPISPSGCSERCSTKRPSGTSGTS